MIRRLEDRKRDMDIKINIIGMTASGKSTIGTIIYDALKDAGFHGVELNLRDGDTYDKIRNEHYEDRLNAITQHKIKKVEITEESVNRNMIDFSINDW